MAPSLCTGSLWGPQGQQEPHSQQVPVSPQATTHLQELDTVTRSPDGENGVRAWGDPKGPSPPAPAQVRNQGDLIPEEKSWMLWAGGILTFPFILKGFSFDCWGQRPPQQPRPFSRAGCCIEFAASHLRAALLPCSWPCSSSSGTHLVPPLPCR